MKPEKFSPLGLYGDREFFFERKNEGYTEAAYGGGPWIGSYRIVGIFAFYHPDGRIATFQTRKIDTGDCTMRGDPIRADYKNESEFKEYVEEHRITLGKKHSLADAIKDWEE